MTDKPTVKRIERTTVGDIRQMLDEYEDHEQVVIHIESHLKHDEPAEYHAVRLLAVANWTASAADHCQAKMQWSRSRTATV